jgi:CheY-like chemotaxis protein
MSKGSRRVVLVVEDDVDIRETLAEILDDEGYQVVTAGDGDEALCKLRDPSQPRPQVILLDLMMPVMSGAQFYAEKQKDPELARIPVVILSAVRRMEAKAPVDFRGEALTKPTEIPSILEAIEKHLA